MKIKFVIILIFLAFLKVEFSHSQHSTKFIEITKNLKPIDSITKIKKFRKGGDKPILKGAFVDEAIYIGDEHIEALFNLKSKEEVIGEIITLLQSPAKNVISALKSSSSKIAGLVKTLSEKPAEEVKAEEPAAEEVKAEEIDKAEEQTSEDESKDESK